LLHHVAHTHVLILNTIEYQQTYKCLPGVQLITFMREIRIHVATFKLTTENVRNAIYEWLMQIIIYQFHGYCKE